MDRPQSLERRMQAEGTGTQSREAAEPEPDGLSPAGIWIRCPVRVLASLREVTFAPLARFRRGGGLAPER
jgi:hypothetical protein